MLDSFDRKCNALGAVVPASCSPYRYEGDAQAIRTLERTFGWAGSEYL